MKAALIQMNSNRDVEHNLKKVQSLIKEAGQGSARLVVLPEMFACIGVKDQVGIATEYFSKRSVVNLIGGWAKDCNLFIVAGSVPYLENPKDKKVLAACFVFSPNGSILAQYNKIHLFDVDVADEKGSYRESDTFIAGGQPVTAEIDQVTLGLSICYDLRFPELFQTYQKQNCQLITVPSAFTYQTGKAHWEILLRARAIETQCFILASNQAGMHDDGRRTWGHSMIVAPNGQVIAQADGESEGVFFADLDFNEQAMLREAMPVRKHKKL